MTQATTNDDGIINLGIGQPQNSILPSLKQIFGSFTSEKLDQINANSLAYGHERGSKEFRTAVADFLNSHGKDSSEKYNLTNSTQSSDLFITCGVSSGLSLVCNLFASSGDTVIIENPTYFLALLLFRDFKINLESVDVEEDGINLVMLETKLKELKEKGKKVAFLYTIPTFQNPTGVTLSHEKRKNILNLARKYNLLIVADEVYQLLHFIPESPPPPSMCSYDTKPDGIVISLGSFSKILAPGLRIGWIESKNSKYLEIVENSGILQSGGGLNPFTSTIVNQLLVNGYQESELQKFKKIYKSRCETLCKALESCPSKKYFDFHKPEGGFFVWISFHNKNVDTVELLTIAKQHKVGFQPGVKFSALKSFSNFLRLSFAYFDEEELKKAVSQLSNAINEYFVKIKIET